MLVFVKFLSGFGFQHFSDIDICLLCNSVKSRVILYFCLSKSHVVLLKSFKSKIVSTGFDSLYSMSEKICIPALQHLHLQQQVDYFAYVMTTINIITLQLASRQRTQVSSWKCH